MKHLDSKQFGFTLVEAVVSVAVFAFVIVSILAVYLTALQLDKKTRSQRAVAENGRYIMEFISNEIRDGYIHYASYPNGIAPVNCQATSECLSLFIQNRAGEILHFRVLNGQLTLSKNGGTPSVMNSTQVRVSKGKFYIQPIGDPLTEELNYDRQPQVTIVLELTSNSGSRPNDNATLNLQSTIAVRKYPGSLTSVAPQTHTLTVNKNGTGSGTVVDNGGFGLNCGSTCAIDVTDGVGVTLTASPAANNTFVGWGGACSGNGSCSVLMNADQTVTATFDADINTFVVDYLIIGGGGGGGRANGAFNGGGGGAGGYSAGNAVVDSGIIYNVVVGAGGAGATGSMASGNSGTASSALGVTAAGGGGGGSYVDGVANGGLTGGSGGGGAAGGSAGGGSSPAGQGNVGAGGSCCNSGGGGGAGAAGQTHCCGGTGGDGWASAIRGVNEHFSGGGAGGGADPGPGGLGGGGQGGDEENVSTNGFNATYYGGGGGGAAGTGGGNPAGTGGNGFQGIVIIRHSDTHASTCTGACAINPIPVAGQTIYVFTGNGTFRPQ